MTASKIGWLVPSEVGGIPNSGMVRIPAAAWAGMLPPPSPNCLPPVVFLLTQAS